MLKNWIGKASTLQWQRLTWSCFLSRPRGNHWTDFWERSFLTVQRRTSANFPLFCLRLSDCPQSRKPAEKRCHFKRRENILPVLRNLGSTEAFPVSADSIWSDSCTVHITCEAQAPADVYCLLPLRIKHALLKASTNLLRYLCYTFSYGTKNKMLVPNQYVSFSRAPAHGLSSTWRAQLRNKWATPLYGPISPPAQAPPGQDIRTWSLTKNPTN